MMLILNRLRGTEGLWSKIIGLLLALVVQIAFNNPYVSVAVGLGYIIGERMGWGEWIGNLTHHRVATLTYESEEGRNNGIYWIVSKFVNPYMDWLKFCRYALGLRGIYWALPTLAPLFFTSINPFVIIGCIVWLGVSFPLACELAYLTYPKLQSKFLNFTTAWNTQEGFYGLAWDIALMILGVSYVLAV